MTEDYINSEPSKLVLAGLSKALARILSEIDAEFEFAKEINGHRKQGGIVLSYAPMSDRVDKGLEEHGLLHCTRCLGEIFNTYFHCLGCEAKNHGYFLCCHCFATDPKVDEVDSERHFVHAVSDIREHGCRYMVRYRLYSRDDQSLRDIVIRAALLHDEKANQPDKKKAKVARVRLIMSFDMDSDEEESDAIANSEGSTMAVGGRINESPGQDSDEEGREEEIEEKEKQQEGAIGEQEKE